MTQTPGWGAPGDEREPVPPYPGWSVEQPPPAPGWGPPGPQPPPAAPPTQDTPGTGPHGGRGGAPQGGWAPGGAPPGQGWGWRQTAPAAKPGVVPLRPLGVGELLDGAITTLRQNPAAMLGLSAVVAAVTQLAQVVALWVLYRDLAVLETATVTTAADLASLLSTSLGSLGISLVLTWLATVLLTGILTVVVSRAVLGEHLSIGDAWAMARPQLPRLIGLTLLVGLIVAAPFVVASVPGLTAAAAGADAGAVALLVTGGVLMAIPVAVWLYVRVVLSTPALMLESDTDSAGVSHRATITGAIRRSSRLVAGSWWRVFGVVLLATALAWVISQVVAVPATLLSFLVGGFTETGTMTLPGLVLTGLAGIVATTITAPFTAGVIVLLYVDRRMRREGLDIALARAAGVGSPAAPPAPPTR
jgi:hypothetical protein